MKRTIKYIVVGVMAVLVTWALCRTFPDPSLIRRGAPESRVLKLFGQPQEVDTSPPYVLWGKNPIIRSINSGECIREFTYYRRGPCAESWHVGFDAKSNVISSYRITFPTSPRFCHRNKSDPGTVFFRRGNF